MSYRSPHRIVVTAEETFHISFDTENDLHKALSLLEQGYALTDVGGRVRSLGSCQDWQGYANNVPITEIHPCTCNLSPEDAQ